MGLIKMIWLITNTYNTIYEKIYVKKCTAVGTIYEKIISMKLWSIFIPVNKWMNLQILKNTKIMVYKRVSKTHQQNFLQKINQGKDRYFFIILYFCLSVLDLEMKENIPKISFNGINQSLEMLPASNKLILI